MILATDIKIELGFTALRIKHKGDREPIVVNMDLVLEKIAELCPQRILDMADFLRSLPK